MDNKTRIGQLVNALNWFKATSTDTMIKLQFNTMIDDVAIRDRENFIKWEKINSDISNIYMNGTDEERKLIDEVYEKFDRDNPSRRRSE